MGWCVADLKAELTRTFLAGGVALAAGSVAAPLVFSWLKKIKSQQTIQKELVEHKAKQGTPTMGGLLILLALVVGAGSAWHPLFLAASLLLLGFGLVGFLDDYVIPKMKPGSRGLDWKPKLALEILAGLGALALSSPPDLVQWGVGLFLILFFSNAYNFADGLDGLAGGLGGLICLGLGGLILLSGSASALTLLPLVAAAGMAYLPFLVLNSPPAKVFMGDVGALPLGALFGWVVFTLGVESPGLHSLLSLLLLSVMMAAELIPPPLQVLSVKLRQGKRLFPFKTPIHHGLQSAGWPETRVTGLFLIIQAGLVFGSWALWLLLSPHGGG
jgi:phospho-N-acetylmuramoyl-pentapeptide-transferase